MLRLEPRREPSKTMFYLTPLLAVILTLLAGAVLFAALGKPSLYGLQLIFIEPLQSARGRSRVRAAKDGFALTTLDDVIG